MYKNNLHILKIKDLLKEYVSYERYKHILSVEETAIFIGKYHNLDLEKLSLASLLHDWGKMYSIKDMINICRDNNVKLSPMEIESHGLLHAKVSRIEAQKRFNINDLEVLNAISSHTTGRLNMSSYEQVIFIADYCEPLRKIDNSKTILDIAIKDLIEGMLKVISQKIIYVIERGLVISPVSIEVYNFYQKEYIKKNKFNTSLY